MTTDRLSSTPYRRFPTRAESGSIGLPVFLLGCALVVAEPNLRDGFIFYAIGIAGLAWSWHALRQASENYVEVSQEHRSARVVSTKRGRTVVADLREQDVVAASMFDGGFVSISPSASPPTLLIEIADGEQTEVQLMLPYFWQRARFRRAWSSAIGAID